MSEQSTPVILCGGSGTRLWPLSRRQTPKQFATLFQGTSLFQATALRAVRATGQDPVVVASLEQRFTVEQQLGQVPTFLAVRQNLVQVFVNLVTNACHATPAGGKVTVASMVDGSNAVITVADTGSGIAAETQARIFEPFFTTKPDGKGTGLGLSIVQGIIENHGGSITVASEVGKGTVFTIRMPMLQRP